MCRNQKSLELGSLFLKCQRPCGSRSRWHAAGLVQRRPAVSESWVCTGRLLWKATLRISASVRLCWLASHGRQFFSPTVRFMPFQWEFLKSRSIWAAISATLTFTTPYGKRSRMAAVYTSPFNHMAGLIGSRCVGPPLTEPFLTPSTVLPRVTFLRFFRSFCRACLFRHTSAGWVDMVVRGSASSS